jgi:type IV pilus assembly protein PilB
VVVAQRLVRKVCERCRVSEDVGALNKADIKNEKKIEDEKERDKYELIQKYLVSHKITRIYRGKGCPICHSTGYAGRIGIFEVLLVEDNIRQAIVQRKDAADIRRLAVESGMRLMIDDGIEKVRQGLTTIEEIVRVTKE